MSRRKVRKRRHLVEAQRAEFRQAKQRLADSVRHRIDETLLYLSHMAAASLPAETGEFIGMLDCGGAHRTIEELDAAAGPWHELPGAKKL